MNLRQPLNMHLLDVVQLRVQIGDNNVCCFAAKAFLNLSEHFVGRTKFYVRTSEAK